MREKLIVTVQEWISVKDRLPEDFDITLVWDGHDIEIHRFERGQWWEADANGYEFEVQYVTHWMPLPQPPKGE